LHNNTYLIIFNEIMLYAIIFYVSS
jgi:hypothetical protein